MRSGLNSSLLLLLTISLTAGGCYTQLAYVQDESYISYTPATTVTQIVEVYVPVPPPNLSPIGGPHPLPPPDPYPVPQPPPVYYPPSAPSNPTATETPYYAPTRNSGFQRGGNNDDDYRSGSRSGGSSSSGR